MCSSSRTLGRDHSRLHGAPTLSLPRPGLALGARLPGARDAGGELLLAPLTFMAREQGFPWCPWEGLGWGWASGVLVSLQCWAKSPVTYRAQRWLNPSPKPGPHKPRGTPGGLCSSGLGKSTQLPSLPSKMRQPHGSHQGSLRTAPRLRPPPWTCSLRGCRPAGGSRRQSRWSSPPPGVRGPGLPQGGESMPVGGGYPLGWGC